MAAALRCERTSRPPLPRPRVSTAAQIRISRRRVGGREFLDYLYVAFTTANAFSPTDTMPMVHWAKVAMGTQALISFAIVGLVLARAVNAFT